MFKGTPLGVASRRIAMGHSRDMPPRPDHLSAGPSDGPVPDGVNPLEALYERFAGRALSYARVVCGIDAAPRVVEQAMGSAAAEHLPGARLEEAGALEAGVRANVRSASVGVFLAERAASPACRQAMAALKQHPPGPRSGGGPSLPRKTDEHTSACATCRDLTDRLRAAEAGFSVAEQAPGGALRSRTLALMSSVAPEVARPGNGGPVARPPRTGAENGVAPPHTPEPFGSSPPAAPKRGLTDWRAEPPQPVSPRLSELRFAPGPMRADNPPAASGASAAAGAEAIVPQPDVIDQAPGAPEPVEATLAAPPAPADMPVDGPAAGPADWQVQPAATAPPPTAAPERPQVQPSPPEHEPRPAPGPVTTPEPPPVETFDAAEVTDCLEGEPEAPPQDPSVAGAPLPASSRRRTGRGLLSRRPLGRLAASAPAQPGRPAPLTPETAAPTIEPIPMATEPTAVAPAVDDTAQAPPEATAEPAPFVAPLLMDAAAAPAPASEDLEPAEAASPPEADGDAPRADGASPVPPLSGSGRPARRRTLVILAAAVAVAAVAAVAGAVALTGGSSRHQEPPKPSAPGVTTPSHPTGAAPAQAPVKRPHHRRRHHHRAHHSSASTPTQTPAPSAPAAAPAPAPSAAVPAVPVTTAPPSPASKRSTPTRSTNSGASNSAPKPAPVSKAPGRTPPPGSTGTAG